MQINLTLRNARVYDVERVDIAEGEEFTLTISDENPGKMRWFTDNDPALDYEVSENGAEITGKANKAGNAMILIMDNALVIQKTLSLNVLTDIQPIATKLDIQVDKPEPK